MVFFLTEYWHISRSGRTDWCCYSQERWTNAYGTVVNELFRCNVSALVAHCEDAERYDGAASKWGVDIVVLCEKIKSLKGANIDALYTRVESFWANPANIDKWAKF